MYFFFEMWSLHYLDWWWNDVPASSGVINTLPPKRLINFWTLNAGGVSERWPSASKRYFQKITARLLFWIKSSILAPFLVDLWILVCNVQIWKKIIIIYIYIELCYSAIVNFHIYLYSTIAVGKTVIATELNIFSS